MGVLLSFCGLDWYSWVQKAMLDFSFMRCKVTLAWQRASQTGSLGCCWLAFCEMESYTKSSQKLQ